MNLNQLTYFAVTARHQHFTRAAEELFISQPSLSYAISSLEEELGTRLFEKKGRNVALTKYGKLFLNHVERALAEIEQGKAELAKLTGATAGHIDMAYITPMSACRVPRLISAFMSIAENAGTTFSFNHGGNASLIEGLQSQKYDVILCSRRPDESKIHTVPLFTQSMEVILPEDHPLAQQPQLSVTQLADYPLVLFQQAGDLDGDSCEALLSRYIHPRIICRTEEELTLYRMVSEGCGLSLIVPTPEIRRFPMRAIPLAEPDFTQRIYLAYLRNRYLPPVVERFIQFALTYEAE
ncbi:MAG: LysR family transcriptional regulator [Clostridia bacterium]|nr:LysR family transcriptional regulator [Clostridia bacterium]